jgi:hypothetical protein
LEKMIFIAISRVKLNTEIKYQLVKGQA